MIVSSGKDYFFPPTLFIKFIKGMTIMKTSTNKITAFLVSLLISFGFAACCLKIPPVSSLISSIGNLNLLTYAGTVILFCVSYLLISLLLDRTIKNNIFDRPGAALTASLFLLAGNLIFLIIMYILEVNVYGSVSARYIWHTMPLWLILLCLLQVLFFSFSA